MPELRRLGVQREAAHADAALHRRAALPQAHARGERGAQPQQRHGAHLPARAERHSDDVRGAQGRALQLAGREPAEDHRGRTGSEVPGCGRDLPRAADGGDAIPLPRREETGGRSVALRVPLQSPQEQLGGDGVAGLGDTGEAAGLPLPVAGAAVCGDIRSVEDGDARNLRARPEGHG
ncbi:hypothetical protein ON010_g17174 [Phytophthora cinnamomi]|nr:hypothetical protein ON010_g17174 [Phytophthora cinnamomi]